jgi:hypothetical protein
VVYRLLDVARPDVLRGVVFVHPDEGTVTNLLWLVIILPI